MTIEHHLCEGLAQVLDQAKLTREALRTQNPTRFGGVVPDCPPTRKDCPETRKDCPKLPEDYPTALPVGCIAPGSVVEMQWAFSCGGCGCGHLPCICGAAEPDPADLMIAVLGKEIASLRDLVAGLEAQNARYVAWNSALGAGNETLRDAVQRLERLNLRQAGSITALLLDASKPRERLSAGWEHLPCITTPMPSTATHERPTIPLGALRAPGGMRIGFKERV